MWKHEDKCIDNPIVSTKLSRFIKSHIIENLQKKLSILEGSVK